MLDEWAPSPWKPVPAEGLAFDPLVATILLTTGASWVEKESEEMAVKVVFIFTRSGPGSTLGTIELTHHYESTAPGIRSLM